MILKSIYVYVPSVLKTSKYMYDVCMYVCMYYVCNVCANQVAAFRCKTFATPSASLCCGRSATGACSFIASFPARRVWRTAWAEPSPTTLTPSSRSPFPKGKTCWSPLLKISWTFPLTAFKMCRWGWVPCVEISALWLCSMYVYMYVCMNILNWTPLISLFETAWCVWMYCTGCMYVCVWMYSFVC